MNGKCKLCGSLGQLRRSHVVARTLFKPIRDPHSLQMWKFSATFSRGKPVQHGHREYMLCNDCEQRFGALENCYKKLNLVGQMHINSMHATTGVFSVDYKRFKLFFLSVLWRASIAGGEFAEFSLGPHEAKIKHMLLEESPGPANIYAICCKMLFHNGKLVQPIFIPLMAKYEARRCITMMFGGIQWYCFTASHAMAPTDALWPSCLREDGTLPMGIQDILDNKCFQKSSIRITAACRKARK